MSEEEAYSALASKPRLDMLRILYRKPSSVEELATNMNLRPITLRHHLRALKEGGFIEEYEARTGGVGRPKTLFKVVKDRAFVGFPKRQYLALADFLVNALQLLLGDRRTKDFLRKIGIEMGRDTARKLTSDHDVKDWSLDAFRRHFVESYLNEIGAEPEIVEVTGNKINYRLHNCIFFEIALKNPEAICENLHMSFHEGLVKGMGKNIELTRPKCMTRGDPYCEHVCIFRD